MFEMGESDPHYERVAALLRSFDTKRVRDFSMTVPTLRRWVSKMVADGGESLKREVAMREQWERGREVLREVRELAMSGKAMSVKTEQALNLLDSAIAEAIQRNHTGWASVLSRHAAILSRGTGTLSATYITRSRLSRSRKTMLLLLTISPNCC